MLALFSGYTPKDQKMKKYSVGDVVMVPCKVTAVHAQGFPLGTYPNGKPRLPEGHEKMNPEELKPFETESPDIVIALTPDNVEVDSFGHCHFSSDAEI